MPPSSRVICLALTFSLAISFAPPSHAISAKQVNIDTKIVETVQPLTEELLFETVHGRDAIADIATLIKTLPDRSVVVESSILSYGRGADFRRIQTQRPILTAGTDRIQPSEIEKIYVSKSSVAAPVAPYLFALIGSQYEGPGAKAASTPGQVCPVTGQPLSQGAHSAGSRGDLARSIDKAGMAAGMGLLTSQAKGDLEGIKVRWEVSPLARYDSFKLNFEAYNENSKRSEPMSLSISYDPDKAAKAAKAASRIKYLPIQFNTSVTSGLVTAQQEFTITPQKMRQFRISVVNFLRGQGEGANDWVPRNSKIEYAGADYWDDYEHEWDDFDEDGYCYDCGHYEPEADEYNYDKDGKYIGATRIIPDKLTRVFIDPERLESYSKGALTGEKLTFVTDYPIIRATFKTEAMNKRTNELLIITTPVIIKDSRAE